MSWLREIGDDVGPITGESFLTTEVTTISHDLEALDFEHLLGLARHVEQLSPADGQPCPVCAISFSSRVSIGSVMTDAGSEALRAFFQKLAPHLMDSIVIVMAPSDPEAIREEATAEFEQLIPQTPYADRPDHVMAESMYFCMATLAFKNPLASRGYDVHDLGQAVLDIVHRNLEGVDPEQDPSRTLEAAERRRRDALESQSTASPDEFVFEIIDGDGDTDYGINIKSCAICKAYSKHDAMDLVPYMCASDDVVSKALDRGLQRTGTIALGAHQCDFRFRRGGPGRALVDQYPGKIIRWID